MSPRRSCRGPRPRRSARSSTTPLREARAAVDELDALASRLTDPTIATRYGELLEWAQDHDAWDADRRAGLVLAGLGLGDIARDRTLGTLSGGQRSRVGLAALLVRRPAALLLDEPTNHLSPALADELEEALGSSPGAVVVASHDRWLRRRWPGRVVALDTPRSHRGNTAP